MHVVPGSTQTLEVTTVATGEIHGHVLDDHGQPVADAFVSIEEYDASFPDANPAVEKEVMVGPDGSFRVDQLPPISYRARAYRRSGGETVVKPVELGADLALTLAATGSVAGTVRLDGAPVNRFTASLVAMPSERGAQTIDAVTADGHFTLEGVAPGHYRATVIADTDTATVELDVGAGHAATADFVLNHAVHVRGRAVDPTTGQGTEYVSVTANDPWSENTFSDANGVFDLVMPFHGPVAISFMKSSDLLRSSWSTVITKELVVGADSIDLGDIPVAEPE